ncbi:hypothetical protein [Thiomonas sp.]
MFDLSDPSYTQGQLDADLTNAFDARRRQNKANALLRQKQYVANGLANLAANRTRKIKAWDDVVWEIVKRVKDFDPETRYRLLGVCRGEDATPEDTMRALRACQEFQFGQIKANAPKDNSDTDIPALRNKYENTNSHG